MEAIPEQHQLTTSHSPKAPVVSQHGRYGDIDIDDGTDNNDTPCSDVCTPGSSAQPHANGVIKTCNALTVDAISMAMTKSATFHDFCDEDEALAAAATYDAGYDSGADDETCRSEGASAVAAPVLLNQQCGSLVASASSMPGSSQDTLAVAGGSNSARSVGRARRARDRLDNFAGWLQRFTVKRKQLTPTSASRLGIRPSVSLCKLYLLCNVSCM